jgi:predicted PurR-regulated permease PerM
MEENMLKELELGPRQRKVITSAITLGAGLILILILGFALKYLAIFVGTFQNVLLPPVVALILTMLLRPYYTRLRKLAGGSQAGALILFFLTILFPIVLFLWFASTFTIDQIMKFARDLPAMVNSIQEFGRAHLPQIMELMDKYGGGSDPELATLLENPGQIVSQALQTWGQKISLSILNFFQSAIGLLTWAVLPVYLAFFLMAQPFEANWIEQFLPFLKKDTREDVIYLFDQFIGILLNFFRGQIVIALAQGVLYAIGFTLVGLPYGIIIGMVLGLLNIIPYLGSIIGLAFALPLAYFGAGGGILRVLLVLVVFGGVQAIEAYLLTPRIMGNRTGLHPALIIFAVFFWGVAFKGIMGMMLAIPLTAFAVVFWRLLKRKYITEVV